MSAPVFLLDVDNTLLDNDRLKADLARELVDLLGTADAERFWAIYEEVRGEQSYVDFPLTVDRFANIRPNDRTSISEMLDSIPFHAYLYGGALEAIAHVDELGTAVIVSDGDPVFQVRKIEGSGLDSAVDGRVVLTTHKQREMEKVFAAYPSKRYVAIDDKTTILADLSTAYPGLVMTVLVRQGKYSTVPAEPSPDLTLSNIGELAGLDADLFTSRLPDFKS